MEWHLAALFHQHEVEHQRAEEAPVEGHLDGQVVGQGLDSSDDIVDGRRGGGRVVSQGRGQGRLGGPGGAGRMASSAESGKFNSYC